MSKLLNVVDLVTSFPDDQGRITVVDGVTFDIDYGETVCIVGESGCGKSVTSMSIMGLIREDGGIIEAGEVWFDGDNLLNKSAKQMRQINGNTLSMIFQEPMSSLNPLLTIGRQITETLMRHQPLSKEAAKQKALRMLNLVRIPEPQKRINQYPFQLSGGQRQRVMIAMALCCDPKLLIADEPTTALDVTIQAQILDLMKSLKQSMGMSIMLITHDLGVVADMADRVVVMYGGQIVEKGTVQQIFKTPQHPYTKGLLQAIPKLEKMAHPLYMIPGNIPKPSEYPLGCRFYDRCEQRKPICQSTPPIKQLAKSQVSRCWIGSSQYDEQLEGQKHE